MNKDILYIGSQSRARHRLLDFAHINYKVIQHGSDETLAAVSSSFDEYVLAIAVDKMKKLEFPLPASIDQNWLYVLTADTLVKDMQSEKILAKPNSKKHAEEMLALQRNGPVEILTGCCLEKFHKNNQQWMRVAHAHWVTGACVEFIVENESIENYFTDIPFILQCCGATVIEDYGLSYLKSITGSYTAVLGLPLYELRVALKKMDFIF